jgi:hypothetical protein
MPIATTFEALKAGISNAFNLQNAATSESKALFLTSAIASVVPAGLYPPSSSPVPLAPTGFEATKVQFTNTFKLNMAATPDTVSKGMAAAIISLVPAVPPVGKIVLETQIKNALTLDMAATPDLVAAIISTAIISYYTSAGVI